MSEVPLPANAINIMLAYPEGEPGGFSGPDRSQLVAMLDAWLDGLFVAPMSWNVSEVLHAIPASPLFARQFSMSDRHVMVSLTFCKSAFPEAIVPVQTELLDAHLDRHQKGWAFRALKAVGWLKDEDFAQRREWAHRRHRAAVLARFGEGALDLAQERVNVGLVFLYDEFQKAFADRWGQTGEDDGVACSFQA